MGFTETITNIITSFMQQTGYITVFIAMIMESMVFPIPSEAVMPFAGFLVAEGKFTFFLVVLISTLASIIGSLLSYAIGYYGEKAILEKYGKYMLLDKEELDATKKFFDKFGEITIFICRFIPVVRHLISIPAGIARMDLTKFIIFTAIGAGMWNAILTYAGIVLKSNWASIMKYSHIVDYFVVLGLIFVFCYYIYKHILRHKQKK